MKFILKMLHFWNWFPLLIYLYYGNILGAKLILCLLSSCTKRTNWRCNLPYLLVFRQYQEHREGSYLFMIGFKKFLVTYIIFSWMHTFFKRQTTLICFVFRCLFLYFCGSRQFKQNIILVLLGYLLPKSSIYFLFCLELID